MGSAVFGFLIAIIVIMGSVIHVLGGTSTLTTQGLIFIDWGGALIVGGGTIAAAFITFSAREVFSIGRICVAVLRKNVDDAPALTKQVILIARETRGDPKAVEGVLSRVSEPFLRDALQLLVDRHDAYKIEQILKERIRAQQERDESTAGILRTLAKYPPALGIVGTVVGLIALLTKLGNGFEAENLGPAMAVGLVATFYGLALTNFVFTPMGENLSLKSVKDIRKRQIVLAGVMAMKNGESVLFVQESLNSYLAVSDRVDVLGVSGQQGKGRAA